MPWLPFSELTRLRADKWSHTESGRDSGDYLKPPKSFGSGWWQEFKARGLERHSRDVNFHALGVFDCGYRLRELNCTDQF